MGDNDGYKERTFTVIPMEDYMRKGKLLNILVIILVLLCVFAIIAFPLIYQYQHPETLSRSKGAVATLSWLECKSVTKIILVWWQIRPPDKHAKCVKMELTRVNQRDSRDLQLLCQSLKAMSVDANEKRDVWRGDRLIIYSAQSPGGYGVYFIGFQNPPPYIGPTLRSSTLGPLLQRICRERTRR
jgi:hypothetical protein